MVHCPDLPHCLKNQQLAVASINLLLLHTIVNMANMKETLAAILLITDAMMMVSTVLPDVRGSIGMIDTIMGHPHHKGGAITGKVFFFYLPVCLLNMQ